MGWGDFWKTKDDKDYEEFLMDPKEAYTKLQEKFKEMDDTIISQTETIKNNDTITADTNSEYERQIANINNDLRIAQQDLDQERILKDIARESASITRRELADEYNQLVIDSKQKHADEYKLMVAKKEAELEKNYHHEVHEFIEEQQEKQNTLIGDIVKAAIVGFYNETKEG